MFLEISQNSKESTCTRVSFLIKLRTWGLQLIKKETLAQVFSCEYCEISKNTFSYRAPPVAASEYSKERDYSVKSVRGQIIKGELHSNYIFLHLVLIGLKWDFITLFTKMNFISSKTHIYARYINGLLFTNMDIF